MVIEQAASQALRVSVFVQSLTGMLVIAALAVLSLKYMKFQVRSWPFFECSTLTAIATRLPSDSPVYAVTNSRLLTQKPGLLLLY